VFPFSTDKAKISEKFQKKVAPVEMVFGSIARGSAQSLEGSNGLDRSALLPNYS
jgi:hypothetical protein